MSWQLLNFRGCCFFHSHMNTKTYKTYKVFKILAVKIKENLWKSNYPWGEGKRQGGAVRGWMKRGEELSFRDFISNCPQGKAQNFWENSFEAKHSASAFKIWDRNWDAFWTNFKDIHFITATRSRLALLYRPLKCKQLIIVGTWGGSREREILASASLSKLFYTNNWIQSFLIEKKKSWLCFIRKLSEWERKEQLGSFISAVLIKETAHVHTQVVLGEDGGGRWDGE